MLAAGKFEGAKGLRRGGLLDMPDFNSNIDDEGEVTTMEHMRAWHGLAAKAVRGVQKGEKPKK